MAAEDSSGNASGPNTAGPNMQGELTVGHFSDTSSIIFPALANYFNNKTFSDLTVLAPDGRRLQCHQIVLSSGSKRFAKLLEQGILQAEPELPVWGVDSDALEAVLQCFYTGECLLNALNVVAIMDAAQRLEVTSLATFCEGFITEVLQPGACCQLLGQAMHFKMEELVQHVLNFSETCFLEVTAHEDFLKSDLPLVTKFLAHHQQRSEATLVLRAGWEWLVADSAHNAHVPDIAPLLPLPEGLGEDDLLNKGNADLHGVLWRQPEILPVPEPVKEEPALGMGHGNNALQSAGGLPQLHMLQQAGLLPQLPMMLLPGAEDGSAAAPSQLVNGLMPNGGWSQSLASELLAQLGSVANGFGALGGPSDLVARLGELQQQHGIKHASSQGEEEEEAAGTYATGPPSQSRARAGGNSRGAGPRGVCQVEGCHTDLGGLRDYHQRYKICEFHLKIPSVLKDGVHQRFCQQCGRFQCISEFEGNKRSCKARLQRHNDRRRKRLEEEPSGGYYNNNKRGRDDDAQRNGTTAVGAGGAAGARGWGEGLANLVALAGLQGL